MTDERFTPRPVAGWYMVAALGSLLFMAFGCFAYVTHVTADPASIPLDQRAAFDAEPLWLTAAYAVAVWVGLAGTVLLVLKRKLAQTLLLVAMVAVTAWLAGLFLVPELSDAVSTNDLAVAVVIVAITWTIFWFARHSAQRGWLR